MINVVVLMQVAAFQQNLYQQGSTDMFIASVNHAHQSESKHNLSCWLLSLIIFNLIIFILVILMKH